MTLAVDWLVEQLQKEYKWFPQTQSELILQAREMELANIAKGTKKESEILREAATSSEINDFQAMSLLNKSLRESRSERWQEIIPELERSGYDVIHDDNHKYTIDTDSQQVKYGIVDYYPKANKVLIRKQNNWIKPGLAWIKRNL